MLVRRYLLAGTELDPMGPWIPSLLPPMSMPGFASIAPVASGESIPGTRVGLGCDRFLYHQRARIPVMYFLALSISR